MVIILLIGLLLVGVTAWLLGRALVIPRMRAAQTAKQIGSYGLQPSGQEGAVMTRPTQSASGRSGLDASHELASFTETIGARLAGRIPGAGADELRRHLMAAGLYTTSPGKIVGYQAFAAILLPIFWLWITAGAGIASILILLGTIMCVIVGWGFPLVVLQRRGRRRIEEIDYEMPELIDTLVTTVEAGIAFSGSLQIASQRSRGPLAEELRLSLQEQNMGLGVSEALGHMLERCDTPA